MTRRQSFVQPSNSYSFQARRSSVHSRCSLKKRASIHSVRFTRTDSCNGGIAAISTAKLDEPPEPSEAEEDHHKVIPFNSIAIITTFCRATAAHGYLYLDLAWKLNHYACVALTLCVLTVSVIGLWFGYRSIIAIMDPDYFESQVKLISAVRTGLPLPRLFITNAGLYNYSALKEYNVSSYEAALLTSLLLGPVAHTPELRRNAKKVNRDYHNLLNRLNTSAADIWPLLSYKCEDLIADCIFSNERISGKLCCETRFISVLGSHGWSLLSTLEAVQQREHVSAGLTLNVRIPKHQLDMDWRYSNRDATVIQKGLRFNINNKQKDPNSASSSIMSMYTNKRTLVALSQTVHDNTGLYQPIFPWQKSKSCISPGSPYSVLATVRENCEANSVNLCSQSIRNCSDVSYPYWEVGGDQVCDFDDVFYLLESNLTSACQKSYREKCENLCEEKLYSFASQVIPLPVYNDNTSNTNSSWYVNGSFTMYFSHLSYMHVSQSRTTILMFLGSLGGQGGLFQGLSMISLTEMVITLSCLLFCAVRACVRQYYT